MRKEYYEAHKKELSARSKAHYAANRKTILARIKAKRDLDPKSARALEKAWRAKHLERLNLKNSQGVNRYRYLKYSAKKRGLVLDLTWAQYLEKMDAAVCHYCHGPLSKSGGGLDRKNSALGYSWENSVPCCKICNLVKGNERISYCGMVEVVGPLIRKERGINCHGLESERISRELRRHHERDVGADHEEK